MIPISKLLQSKGNEVWSVKPDSPVFDALGFMAEKNIGALPVLEDGKLAGMFSERDYARKIILKGKTSKDTKVREVMSTKLYTVTPGQTVEDCMTIMTARHIRHLPVVEDGEMKAMISIGDVVKAIISQQKELIKQLEDYIAGR